MYGIAVLIHHKLVARELVLHPWTRAKSSAPLVSFPDPPVLRTKEGLVYIYIRSEFLIVLIQQL